MTVQQLVQTKLLTKIKKVKHPDLRYSFGLLRAFRKCKTKRDKVCNENITIKSHKSTFFSYEA